uniref:Uncharacterized protein n=1 Tax=Chenopodium quinoa TaxID=63459 RepID=A0A803LL01_CHEQI
MGSNVFGTPVTVATLRAMPEYQGKNSITQQDRAKVALEKANAESKAVDARNYVEKLQCRFGDDVVYTEIREAGHYDQAERVGIWQALDNKLSNGRLVNKACEQGGYISGSIGNTSKPVFEAIMTLPKPK